MSGPYSIGSSHWPGLSKLIEEAGEVQQVVGKLIATGGAVKHWEGSDLRERLHEELGDLVAACFFVMEANGLDEEAIRARYQQKLALFHRWHVEQADSVPPADFASVVSPGLPRGGPHNFISNCALACGEPISTCQMCPQACPDATRFEKKGPF